MKFSHKEIGGKNNRLSNILDNGTWVATCLGATIFEILRISVQSTETWAHGTWIWAISWKLIVSPLVGFLVAKIMGKFLGWIINDALAEALLVYSTVFSTFAMCNLLGLSGPIAILVFNIFFDHSQLSREAELSIKKFSNVMTFFAGVYLSGTAGYVWLEQALSEWGHISSTALWKDVFWICILYLFVMSIRLVVLQSTAYLLKTECIRWREAMLISLGEVRGHVNILLAFIVLNDPELSWTQHDCTDPENRFDPANPFLHSRATFIPNYGACAHDIYDISVALNSPLSAKVSEFKLSELYQIGTQKIFFYGMGVLILTQVINASLLEKCTSMLGIYQISSG